MNKKKQKEVYLYCVNLHKENHELETWNNERNVKSKRGIKQFLKKKKKNDYYFTCIKIDRKHHTITTWHELKEDADHGNQKK